LVIGSKDVKMGNVKLTCAEGDTDLLLKAEKSDEELSRASPVLLEMLDTKGDGPVPQEKLGGRMWDIDADDAVGESGRMGAVFNRDGR
jgi:hypothetical protein